MATQLKGRPGRKWTWALALVGLVMAGAAATQEATAPARPREVLKSAIDLYKRGDYDAAMPLFVLAQTRQDELSATEKQDLLSYAAQNQKAQRGRQEGGGLVVRAGEALGEGRLPEAGKLLKTASANQYLTPADRQRLSELNQELAIAAAGAGQAAKTTARNLVAEARALLQKGELDAAEAVAGQAEQASSSVMSWLNPLQDTPAKVRRDIQAARQKHEASRERKEAPRDAAPASSAWSLANVKGLFTRGDKPSADAEQPESARPFIDPVPAAKTPLRPRVEAERKEPSPDQVLAEMQRRSATAPSKPAPPGARPDPRVLVRDARALMKKGQFEEAERLLSQATAIPGTTWGLFQDSPEKLRRDLADARARRDRDESVKLLAEARNLFGQGKLDEAKVAAWQAQKLHGPYRPFDFGDRPQWLLEEIQRVEAKRQNRIPERDETLLAQAAPAKNAPPKGRPLVSATAQAETRNRAVALVREARQLEQQGRLLEALDKANQAQQMKAVFGPEEDSPGAVQMALAGKCNRQIQALLQQATDKVGASSGEPARLHAAQLDLEQARQLAQAFRLDTHLIDQRILALQQLAAANGAALARLVTPAPTGLHQTAAIAPQVQRQQQAGSDKLDKARLELRAGNTALARRLAEEVLDPSCGVQPDAEALLRTIYAEEHNQRMLAARRAFDAGADAFRTGNYNQARSIFEGLDLQLLTPDIQGRLRDIMGSKEMLPIVQTAQQESLTLPGAPLDVPGRASVGGSSQELNSVRAMEEVQFQQLRERGLAAQRLAMENFKSGQTAQAIEGLTAHLKDLEGVQLDPERLALLKRPVENRLQQYRTMQAQAVLKNEQKNLLASGHNETKVQLGKQKEQNEVSELVKQYNQLMKEGKEKEAWVMATKASELDPDNPTLKAAIEIAKYKHRQKEWDKNRDANEQMFLESLNNDMVGRVPSPDNPYAMTQSDKDRLSKRKPGASGMSTQKRTPLERAIEYKLNEPFSATWKDDPLVTVIDDLRTMTGINVVINTRALDEAGVRSDQPLTLTVNQIPLRSALNHLLSRAKLTYLIKDNALVITTEDDGKGKTRTVVYPVADLVVPVENHPLSDFWNLEKTLAPFQKGNNVNMPGPSPVLGPNSMSQGTPVSSYSSGLGAASGPGMQEQQQKGPRVRGNTIEDHLMTLIKNTVARDTWDDFGGEGRIQYFPLGMALVINQTQEAQEEITELLAALRRLQDLQVSIEMRLVSVSEAFFEFMGVNFDVNLRTPTSRREFDLVNSAFVQQPFVNRNLDNLNMVTGLTPANTLTPDLNIPIQNTSFGFAQPPFGNFPGTIGADGGLSLGLAFLSEIQVFMFMEAAQGDRRTQIMQAPKITVFNGQTATITVSETQFFMLGVTLNSVNGQLVFTPQNTPVAINTVGMIVTPVVSADRRFVRLDLLPIITNPTNAITPLIPIQFAVPNIVDGPGIGGTIVGQPTIFQLFFQQPNFQSISVSTTVNVPDGGTVLLGGLKTLSEGRNEYGPPIISKIPYLSRLFKNVGYGREAQSLMIMVTPRIIINEEEEQVFMGTVPPVPRP